MSCPVPSSDLLVSLLHMCWVMARVQRAWMEESWLAPRLVIKSATPLPSLRHSLTFRFSSQTSKIDYTINSFDPSTSLGGARRALTDPGEDEPKGREVSASGSPFRLRLGKEASTLPLNSSFLPLPWAGSFLSVDHKET